MEQPPVDVDQKLSAYLQRMDQRIDAIRRSRDIPVKFTDTPDKPIIGKIYYFSNTVGATITQEGYWGYTSAGWVLLG